MTPRSRFAAVFTALMFFWAGIFWVGCFDFDQRNLLVAYAVIVCTGISAFVASFAAWGRP